MLRSFDLSWGDSPEDADVRTCFRVLACLRGQRKKHRVPVFKLWIWKSHCHEWKGLFSPSWEDVYVDADTRGKKTLSLLLVGNFLGQACVRRTLFLF